MKTVIKITSLVFTIFILLSCIEQEGDYGEVGNEVISNLTNKEWNRKYHSVLDDGTEIDMDVTYVLKDNGNGIYKETTTYKSGKIEERTSYFHWTFTTPNFKYIYLDLDCYWEIDKLTKSHLCIYETWDDPVVTPGQFYKDYQEYNYINETK